MHASITKLLLHRRRYTTNCTVAGYFDENCRDDRSNSSLFAPAVEGGKNTNSANCSRAVLCRAASTPSGTKDDACPPCETIADLRISSNDDMPRMVLFSRCTMRHAPIKLSAAGLYKSTTAELVRPLPEWCRRCTTTHTSKMSSFELQQSTVRHVSHLRSEPPKRPPR